MSPGEPYELGVICLNEILIELLRRFTQLLKTFLSALPARPRHPGGGGPRAEMQASEARDSVIVGVGGTSRGSSRPPFRGAACRPPAPALRGRSLEEVVLAVDALPAAEAALGQRRVAVAAREALAVPVAVQSLQDEAVQDVLVTAGTQRDLCGRRSRAPLGAGAIAGSPLPTSPRIQGCSGGPLPCMPFSLASVSCCLAPQGQGVPAPARLETGTPDWV